MIKHPTSRAERRLLKMKKELKHSDAKGTTHGIRREFTEETTEDQGSDSSIS